MTLIVSIITLVLAFVISYINAKSINYEQILVTMIGTIFGTLLVLTFMYPIIYKFGVEKARIAILLIVFGIAIIGGFLFQFVDFSFISKAISLIENYIIIILIIIMIFMVIII